MIVLEYILPKPAMVKWLVDRFGGKWMLTDDARHWCHKHLSMLPKVEYAGRFGGDDTFYLEFKSDEDATVFALKWLT